MSAARLLHSILIFAVALGCGADSGAPPNAPPPPEVGVATPLVRKLVEWDAFTGRLEAVSRVEVRARVSGYLEAVHFTDGAMVEQGAPLFSIDPRPFQAELDRRRGELNTALARRDLTRQLLDRTERLLERNAASEEERDQRAGELAQAEATVAAAQGAVTAAELDLEFTSVKAPISGRIGRHLVSAGNLIDGGSSLATLLTTINTLDPIHAYFDADEASYLKYTRLDREGKRPSSRDVANPVFLGLEDEDGFPHLGYMDFVDNRLDSDTGTMRGRAIFDNPDGVLTPGLFARIRLRGSSEYDALLLPDAAIATDQTNRVVWVVGDGDAVQPRVVTLGPMAYGLRVIHSGLGENERVVVSGLQRLRPGATVTPRAEELQAIQGDELPSVPPSGEAR
ncbi:MAG: MexE family multidrug efflux RND transporter periplasmic adaptor subunit [Planctomycetota bacterium]|nr:MAG: MexE family multidrug efflux RND transporter periplasmic adaptor subunit [Planctomycetota bacterium]